MKNYMFKGGLRCLMKDYKCFKLGYDLILVGSSFDYFEIPIFICNSGFKSTNVVEAIYSQILFLNSSFQIAINSNLAAINKLNLKIQGPKVFHFL